MTATGTELPDRVGGRLCLDFLNTVDPRLGDERREYLPSAEALLAWASAARITAPQVLRRFADQVQSHPAAAGVEHRRVLAYREALARVVSAAVAGRAVDGVDLAQVNAVLREATAHHVLLPGERGGVRDGWLPGGGLDELLWPVAIDAWDLLTEPALDRVKECPGDHGACGWFFLDTSRSGTRRWCDMRTCGNRAKARAHYSRVRA